MIFERNVCVPKVVNVTRLIYFISIHDIQSSICQWRSMTQFWILPQARITFIEFDSQGPHKNLYYSLHMWTTLKLGLAQKQIKCIFHVWHYTDVSFYLTDVNIKESNKHRAPAFTFGNRCVYIYSWSVKKVLQTNNLQSAI